MKKPTDMRETEIRISLDLSPRIRFCLLLMLSLLCVPFELGSETLQLVSHFPPPSGVLNRLITDGGSGASPVDTILNKNDGNTLLAPHAGGRVGIGYTDPVKTLDVYGDVVVSGTLYSEGVPMAFLGGFFAQSASNPTCATPNLLPHPGPPCGCPDGFHPQLLQTTCMGLPLSGGASCPGYFALSYCGR